jgi:mono/diheme cytochrome c family protein
MTRLTRPAVPVVVTAVLVVVAAVGSSGQQTGRPPLPPLSIESLGATDSYLFYCAPCHGSTGVGDGPVATALRTKPADLTTLAERNGGEFPRARVRGYVSGTGRAIPAHGTGDMPVWGPAFRALDASDTRAKVRIDGIVAYVEALQPKDNGAVLFRDHCASCHGTSGRGNGPVAEVLRTAPPDLTQFTKRNGGMFPSERVARIIDGRDVPAHGDRDMPVWGTTFKRESADANDEAVKNRIDALVRFLRSIQERAAE